MAALIRYFCDFYEEVLVKKADPRVADLPLMSSVFNILAICFVYVKFSTQWGPAWMKSKEPYDPKNVMIVFDIAQIIVNSYLFYVGITVPFLELRYSFICEEVNYSNDPPHGFIAKQVWLYFIVKVLDLLDTVFMVLRKKDRQISFLHVYHHTAMALGTWFAAKYIAGGHVIMIGVINTFVHTVMYCYYFLTALNPEYKKSIWWKKHLTELQMIQFIFLAWHSAVAALNPYCNFPKILTALFFPQNCFMLMMFWDFYKKNYLKKENNQPKKVTDDKMETNNNNMEKTKET